MYVDLFVAIKRKNMFLNSKAVMVNISQYLILLYIEVGNTL